MHLNQAFRYLDGLLRDVQSSTSRSAPVNWAKPLYCPSCGQPYARATGSLPPASVTSMRTEGSAGWERQSKMRTPLFRDRAFPELHLLRHREEFETARDVLELDGIRAASCPCACDPSAIPAQKRASFETLQTASKLLILFWSGRPDLNRGPLGPEPSALARLSHAPTAGRTNRYFITPSDSKATGKTTPRAGAAPRTRPGRWRAPAPTRETRQAPRGGSCR